MKKLLGIVVLGLLLASSNLFAESFKLNQFNKWLSENGYHQYLTEQGSNNLNIKIKNKALSATNIAYHSNPNRDTLIYYLWKYSYRDRSSHLKEFKPTNNSYDFKFNLIEDEFIKKQMKTKGILSYLYYQDGEVLIDEFSPKERLGEFLNNETKFYSMSMGKSVTCLLYTSPSPRD